MASSSGYSPLTRAALETPTAMVSTPWPTTRFTAPTPARRPCTGASATTRSCTAAARSQVAVIAVSFASRRVSLAWAAWARAPSTRATAASADVVSTRRYCSGTASRAWSTTALGTANTRVYSRAARSTTAPARPRTPSTAAARTDSTRLYSSAARSRVYRTTASGRSAACCPAADARAASSSTQARTATTAARGRAVTRSTRAKLASEVRAALAETARRGASNIMARSRQYHRAWCR
mmetsp:Transcript_123747/g.283722  ORF Transcript_123747/g.283722 Transcript_123747/m.283722 type:complete len:238 (+) Transcript_123747:122-835(+)